MAFPQDITVSGTLPSELYKQHVSSLYDDDNNTSADDAEMILQTVLSALASQKDLGRGEQDNPEEIPAFLWKTLTYNQTSEDESNKPNPDVDHNYEWWMGTRLIGAVLPKMSPFEIHTVANQSIVFTEGSLTHGSLCLLLCCYALRQCPPPPIVQRWKRWQSLVCETIRLYQLYGIALANVAVPLWIDYVLPASQQVIRGLPPDDAGVYHVAFLASLVGTTSNLVVRECSQPVKKKKSSNISGKVADSILSHILQLLEVVRQVVDEYGHSETLLVWSHPWREHSESFVAATTTERHNEEVEFLQRCNDLAWWTQTAHRHERVAGMDTSWDRFGIALLALVAFDGRPLVLAPNYIWRTWFPHVLILFQETGNNQYPLLFRQLPLSLLDNILRAIPKHSLPATRTNAKKPDSPFETFQQLSNRILLRVRNDGEDDDEDDDDNDNVERQMESKANTEIIVSLMKGLLERYQPENQVKIIRKLVHDCPHPGLQAKFMDLLRTVVFEPSAAVALWTYIGSFVKDLLVHVDEETQVLINIEDVVKKVELYVGAITMIQLWCLVSGKMPKRINRQKLRAFYKVLVHMLGSWLTDTVTTPPDDFYRLYLLEGALEQVMRVLEDARNKKKEEPETDHSRSSAATEESVEEPPALPPTISIPEPKQVIVGEADIFS
jgi:hypothetical protein